MYMSRLYERRAGRDIPHWMGAAVLGRGAAVAYFNDGRG